MILMSVKGGCKGGKKRNARGAPGAKWGGRSFFGRE